MNRNVRYKDEAGKVYGRWTVIGYAGLDASRMTAWLCKCACGTSRTVKGRDLRKGSSQSCGCLLKEKQARRLASLAKDHTGRKFGRLTALYSIPERQGEKIMWACRCDCGQITTAIASHLTGGRIRSCGCLQREWASEHTFKDRKGQVFGRLTVLEDTGKRKNRAVIWRCRCECGNIVEKLSTTLKNIASCGCYRKEVAAKLKYIDGRAKSRRHLRFLNRKRYCKQKSRTPEWSNLLAIKEIYDNCPDGYDVDHIVPLQGELVSGLHVPNNLQYLTRSENSRKRNKFEPQFIVA
jgi:hypothetical protein